MKGYLLDSNVLIAALHDKFEVRRMIAHHAISNCYLSEITIAELLYGAYNSQFIEKNLAQVAQIKEEYSVLPISNILNEYGLQMAHLKKMKRHNIGSNDVFIGATAVAYNLTLVTRNQKDFVELDSIQLEDWTKPEFNPFLQTI